MAALTKKVSAPELQKSNDVKSSTVSYPFWFGGSASCFATFFTHPLDLGECPKFSGGNWANPAQSRYYYCNLRSDRSPRLTNPGPVTNTSHRRRKIEHA